VLSHFSNMGTDNDCSTSLEAVPVSVHYLELAFPLVCISLVQVTVDR